jgi:hypothetical protein
MPASVPALPRRTQDFACVDIEADAPYREARAVALYQLAHIEHGRGIQHLSLDAARRETFPRALLAVAARETGRCG